MKLIPPLLISLLALPVGAIAANDVATGANPASHYTAQVNRDFGRALPLGDQRDFDDARRGLLATLPGNIVRNDKGEVMWDGQRFGFIENAAPDSVNPSLWRQEQLNNVHGLFKVTDGIWQLRGYDVSNITLVEGKTGWIIIDPLTTAEVARATLELAQQKLGRRPVVAVIYTHGHPDHYGGVLGVTDLEAVKAGKVRVIAPSGFMESAVAEGVLAGNAMTRRVQYQYGVPVPAGEKGTVGVGLGKSIAVGTVGLIAPTETVTRTGEALTVDGVRIVFQMANGSEAPSEFALYFPDKQALCLSEVVTAHMHNIYTVRGAKTRDALAWSKYINEMLDLFPQATVAFRSHHWPVWSAERVREHLVNQRDMYRFIHDEALRLANNGMTMSDLANADWYPKALQQDFSAHGYYGTLSHNLRGVYNFYLGYYDSNPATLNPLPRIEMARSYVDAMGGAQAVLAKMKKATDAGNYRWAVEIGNQLVFAEPGNRAARTAQAAALEQLGYQAESGVWRNSYLTAARELRQGVDKNTAAPKHSPELFRDMPPDLLFDYLAVRLNHKKTDGVKLGINIRYSDLAEDYALELSNSVLNNTKGRVLAKPDVSLTLTRTAMFKLLVLKTPMPQLLASGEIQLIGNAKALGQLFGNLDNFDIWFPIVTP